MNILSETTSVINNLGLIVETGVFSDTAPDEYVVITPIFQDYQLLTDNRPDFETQEVRLSIYSKGNYLAIMQEILTALVLAKFNVTARQYIGYDDDTHYHHFILDTAKNYPLKKMHG